MRRAFAILLIVFVSLHAALAVAQAPPTAMMPQSDPRGIATWSVPERWKATVTHGRDEGALSRIQKSAIATVASLTGAKVEVFGLYEVASGHWLGLSSSSLLVVLQPGPAEGLGARDVAAIRAEVERQADEHNASVAKGGLFAPSSIAAVTSDPVHFTITYTEAPPAGAKGGRTVSHVVVTREGLLNFQFSLTAADADRLAGDVDAVIASIAIAPAHQVTGFLIGGLSPSLAGAILGAMLGVATVTAETLRRRAARKVALASLRAQGVGIA